MWDLEKWKVKSEKGKGEEEEQTRENKEEVLSPFPETPPPPPKKKKNQLLIIFHICGELLVSTDAWVAWKNLLPTYLFARS